MELTGVETDEGDMTTDAAEITSSTSVMMTTVAGNEYAIGYISLGVLDDSVKAVKVDGIEATAENVLDGSYTLARPFNVVTGANVSEVAQDFMNFIGLRYCREEVCFLLHYPYTSPSLYAGYCSSNQKSRERAEFLVSYIIRSQEGNTSN